MELLLEVAGVVEVAVQYNPMPSLATREPTLLSLAVVVEAVALGLMVVLAV
jgi:hypothetical protein